MRTTKSQVESAFKALVKEIGGRVATAYNDHGAYTLDYAGCYGGYVIEKICDDSSGVSHPFGDRRMKAEEAYNAFWFAVEVLRMTKAVSI